MLVIDSLLTDSTPIEKTYSRYSGSRKLESSVSRLLVMPGNFSENPSASVANAAHAPCEMIPCGWYPKMYLRVGSRSCVL